jgi:hypothetical protein
VEAVLAFNPDVILDLRASSKGGSAKPEAAWRELPELTAIRRGTVHEIQDEFVPHDSQMIAKTAVLFGRLIHPEVPPTEWEGH